MSSDNLPSTHRAILTPMTREIATKMVARMMGSYPSLNLSEPKIYAAEMVRTLLEFSVHTAERGIAQAMTDSPSFLPAVPAVLVACERYKLDAVGPVWEERSSRQLAERAAIEAGNKEESVEQRRAVIERLWPRALDGGGPKREIKDDLGFRRFSNDDLKSIYAPKPPVARET